MDLKNQEKIGISCLTSFLVRKTEAPLGTWELARPPPALQLQI